MTDMSLGFIMKSVNGVSAILDCKRTLSFENLGKGNLSIATRSVKPTVNNVLLLVGCVVCGKNALSQTKGHGIHASNSCVEKEKEMKK